MRLERLTTTLYTNVHLPEFWSKPRVALCMHAYDLLICTMTREKGTISSHYCRGLDTPHHFFSCSVQPENEFQRGNPALATRNVPLSFCASQDIRHPPSVIRRDCKYYMNYCGTNRRSPSHNTQKINLYPASCFTFSIFCLNITLRPIPIA
jgi:hypothetical protein